MNYTVSRNYEVKITTYMDEEDEEYYTYALYSKMIGKDSVQFKIMEPMRDEQCYYLTVCDKELLYADPERQRCAVFRAPFDQKEIEMELEEIDEYDEDICTMVSTAIQILYHDILKDMMPPLQLIRLQAPPTKEDLPF